MLPEPAADTPADTPATIPQVLSLKDCTALSDEDLVAHMAAGGLEVNIDGALSEWGSRVDALLHKLEHSVLKWRADGEDRTLLLRFVETARPADADETGDKLITFKADG